MVSIFFLVFFTGLDEVLAEHIAHLFIRDPLSLFSEKLELDDTVEVDHFEVSFYCIMFLHWFLHYITTLKLYLVYTLSLKKNLQ